MLLEATVLVPELLVTLVATLPLLAVLLLPPVVVAVLVLVVPSTWCCRRPD